MRCVSSWKTRDTVRSAAANGAEALAHSATEGAALRDLPRLMMPIDGRLGVPRKAAGRSQLAPIPVVVITAAGESRASPSRSAGLAQAAASRSRARNLANIADG